MSAKSGIELFAASIVTRTSVYLTACLGILLMIAILLRQFYPPDARKLTLLEEGVTLSATLCFTYAAVWCAGFLAVISTKNKLQRSNASRPPRGAPSDKGHEPVKRVADAALLASGGATGPDREYAPPKQSSHNGAATLLSASQFAPRDSQ